MTTALASIPTAAPAQPLNVAADPPTGSFLEGLKPYTALPLVIAYANRETRAGYHVTEVKSGRFAALDCGGNPEAWSETFIQVWDVPGEPQARMMTVGKFLAIMEKVGDDVGLDRGSRLTFECGDDVGVIGLYAVEGVTVETDRVLVSLSARHASCKPRDRWFEDHGIAMPTRLTETDAVAERTIRETAATCCGGSGRAGSGRC
jgi:hypothetical protein